jgi:hypothetical protein
MTADGTYPTPRAGETITTAAELDALTAVGTILRDNGGLPLWRDRHFGWCSANGTRDIATDAVIEDGAPLTVLFRPDAPQPAPGDDVRCAQCEAGLTAAQVDQVTSVLQAATHLTMVSAMRPDEAIRQVAQAVAAFTPAPVPDDTVERAVTRMEISARDHRESAAQCEDRGDMDGYSASTDAADILDRHIREIRAAATAARAGEAEWTPVWDDGLAILRAADVLRQTGDSAYLPDVRDALRAAHGLPRAPRPACVNPEPLAAQRGGEVADREAVQRRIDLTLKNVARFADLAAKTPGERQSIIAALAEAQEDVALLAARGTAPTEVEWAVRWSDGNEWTGLSEASARLTATTEPDVTIIQRDVSAWREVQP